MNDQDKISPQSDWERGHRSERVKGMAEPISLLYSNENKIVSSGIRAWLSKIEEVSFRALLLVLLKPWRAWTKINGHVKEHRTYEKKYLEIRILKN